jgi:DNA-binding CsgD family transcriptional regulator/PAS domain-containing protein
MLISAARLSEVIGAIYDCVIDAHRWGATLTDLCKATSFATGALGTNLLPSGEVLLSASVGIAPDWIERMASYDEDVMRIWGGVDRIRQYPMDEPIVCSRVSDRATWPDNPYYTDWARPQGLIDAVSIVLARDSGLLGSLTFGRHESAGEVTEPELEVLRLIAPHLRRAVTITRLLDRETLAASTFAASLEVLTVAVILVDDQLTIVHANREARRLLAARQSISSQGGRLQLSSAAATNALRRAASVAARDEAALGTRGMGLAMGGGETPPSLAHVLPLPKRAVRSDIAPQATVAVFIAPAADPPRLPEDALALLYDFTPAESRVFELIVEGQSPIDVARMLGIARSTVKTHLLRVFDKTGLHRQADLVKLAASLSLPV